MIQPNAIPNDAVLAVNGVGKCFRRYASRWAQAWELLSGQTRHEKLWVFRDLNFEVRSGEAVGIIGRNGAGKSTLLKLLAGVQQPDSGSITRSGSVMSILELGVGFHGDFSGRENARQLMLLQGMTTRQIEDILPAIADFAEIGDYFDQPVHTYSSGMQMRVAFAVATCTQPDLLIVDEALAVGDAYFQHKCYERIRGMRDAGAAVLLVSHDPGAIRSLCQRALLLHDGRIVCDATPSEVLELYNQLLAPSLSHQHAQLVAQSGNTASHVGRRAGTGEVRIADFAFTPMSGAGQQASSGAAPALRAHAAVSGEPVLLRVSLEVVSAVPDLTLGLLIRDRLGNDMFGTNTHHHQVVLHAERPGMLEVQWHIASFALGPGHYSLTLAAHAGASHPAGNYDWWDRCHTFQVLPAPGPLSIGPVALNVRIESSPACSQGPT